MSLTTVTSYIEQPFAIPESAFTNYDATLYVPEGTEAEYRALSAWNKFFRIVEGASGIENGKLKIENEAGAWYDMQGRRISNGQLIIDNGQLKPGLYIHNGRKVVIK